MRLSYILVALTVVIAPLVHSQSLHPGSISLTGGGSYSWIDGDGDARYWFDPYSTSKADVAPTTNIDIRFPLKVLNLNIMTGIGYREKGQSVPNTQVIFNWDPYPHELEIKTWAHALLIPLALEWQLDAGPVWLALRSGAFGEVFVSQKMSWYVDGERYGGVPQARKKAGDVGLLGGADLGVRLQHIGVFIGANYEYGLSGVTEFPGDVYGYYAYGSLPNTSAMRAVEVHSGIRWYFRE